MNYLPFGRTGLKVSRMALGTWYLPHQTQTADNGIYPVDKDNASKLFERAWDIGINFFDTADVYRGVYDRKASGDYSTTGQSEKILGECLKGRGRDEFVLATKAMGATGPLPNDSGLGRKHLKSAVKKSLERLGLDYIDIYFAHAPDPLTGAGELIRTMNMLEIEGSILHYAVSNHTVLQLKEMIEISEKTGLEAPAGVQDKYSLLERTFESLELPLISKYGMGAMIYSPLAQGILAGRYLHEDSTVSRDSYEQIFNLEKKSKGRAQMLTAFADYSKAKGMKMSQLALSWLMSKSALLIPIIGASNIAQLEENVEAADYSMSSAEAKEIEGFFSLD